jgi:hypothetical protein
MRLNAQWLAAGKAWGVYECHKALAKTLHPGTAILHHIRRPCPAMDSISLMNESSPVSSALKTAPETWSATYSP